MDPIAEAIAARVEAAATECLGRVGLDLQGRAQRDAPIEEGTLRGSGATTLERRSDGAVVVVSFSTPYAARQHEELTWRHPMGGRAKYLEANLKMMVPVYRSALRSAVAGAIAGTV